MEVDALPVCGVVWDGMAFSAYSSEGIIAGYGTFEQNLASTGGVITGTVNRGLSRFINRKVSIAFEGADGTCSLFR